jgi:UDP-N-acetylglucosamine acyltransferase
MAVSPSSRIHPSALIAPEAEIAENVEIGPFAIIEGPVRIGPGCRIKPYVHLIGPLTMGANNQVFTGCVLGERPQHMRYADEPTSVEIGDENVFREQVTVHRGTPHSWKTVIGNKNFFMAHSHVAHDCVVGNHCIMANGALLGGHCVVGDGVFLSGNCAVHQFVRLGRLSLLSGVSASTKDIPPFVMQQHINCIVGINVVGMRRAGISTPDIDAVRQAFHILYRQALTLPVALAQIESRFGTVGVITELIEFIRTSSRGINLAGSHNRVAA